VLRLTKWILEDEGYRVYAAETAKEALAIAEELQCGLDLLLTDMVMPVTDGHDLILAVRRMCPQTHTMAMSGAFSHGDIRQRDYFVLRKPFTRDGLLAAARQILNPQSLGGGG
jgi:two-component system, cell cycle sensor histidine kinase and response regulator CckA